MAGLFHRRTHEVRAVDGISFEIERGEIVGYIGPNGAGNSTTVKILSGIMHEEPKRANSTELSGTHELYSKLGGCKMCALRLARIVGQRHWWFFLVREPLVLGMRLLAWCNRIDRRQHVAPNPECNGCIRFMKNELEAKSPTFRFLNGIIGDPFSRLRNARLAAEEVSEAKRYAAQAMLTDDPAP